MPMAWCPSHRTTRLILAAPCKAFVMETKIGDFVTVTRDGAIAVVTMDRGDGRNALSRQLILELTEAARGFADDLQTQVVILKGKGAFTAGADLKDPQMDRRRANGLLQRRPMVRIGPELCEAW